MQTNTRSQPIKLWTPLYAGILAVNAFTFTIMYMQIAVFPTYLAEVGGDRALAGLATGFYTGAALFLRPAVGFALDRYGRRTGLLIGLVTFIVSLSLYFFLSRSVGPFLLLRVVSGAAFCFLSTTAGAVVADSVPAERLGEGIGFFAFSTIIGTALGPIVGLALNGRFGFSAFLLGGFGIGVLGFAVGIAAIRLIPPASAAARPSLNGASDERVGAAGFAPSLCLFLAAVSLGFILSYIHAFGSERNVANGAHFFTFYSLTVLLVRMLGSKLMDSLSPSALAYSSLASLSLCFGLLVFADSYAWIMAAACLFGAGMGVIQPLLNMLQIKLVPARLRGTASAAYFAAMDLGVTMGSIGLGLVLSRVGFGGIFLVLISLLFAAAAVFRFSIKPLLGAGRS